MKFLAFDTSSSVCSVALHVDGLVLSRVQQRGPQQAQCLLPLIDELLVDSGCTLSSLDAVVFGRGPGSFTGVRIAASTAQALAFAEDLPVIPISTLRTLAQRAYEKHDATHVLSAIDARQKEIYWGVYQTNDQKIMCAIQDEVVAPATEVFIPERAVSWVGVGSGWQSDGTLLSTRFQDNLIAIYPDEIPCAESMLDIAITEFLSGNTVSAEEALPVYIRDKVT